MSRRETLSLQTLSQRLHKPLLRIASAAVSCAFLVVVSVRLIDRPVATWVHEHLGDSRFAWLRLYRDGHLLPIGPFSFMAGPAEALGPLALLVLVLLALAATAGWRPKGRVRAVLALCLSAVVALAVNHEMKIVFGRTWPESWLGDNPSWIRDGVFEFSPFHGGQGWDSFPSGHTSVITTAATLLWLIWPELRILWAAMVAMVVTGLIGGNYHFVSDIIGGLYLGVAIGLGSAALMVSTSGRFGRPVIQRRSPAEPNSPRGVKGQPTPDGSVDVRTSRFH
jgi:membrane-associated phospholipid phosphatase